MKQVFIKLIILYVLSIIPVAAYNYYFDPFGIFNETSLRLGYEPGHEPNQHYAKIRHLINDKHSWDSYLFGNSRVGKINPELIPGGNYYNMNYSAGVPGEHLHDIKVMLQKGVPVRNVMIALDNVSYAERPEDHRWQIMRNPYDLSIYKRVLFQIEYLCSVPRFSIMKYIRPPKDESLLYFNITGNGMQDLTNIDINIERNLGKHVGSERFNKANIDISPMSGSNGEKLIEDTIQDVSEIIKLSKSHNFNLYFFINPIHKLYYAQGDPYLFLLFKKKLAQITGYWDFSGFNSITTDNYYYYETSHYRTMVGNLIICRMTNCPNMEVPKDFGFFVTNENVDQYIKNQEDRLNAFNKGNMIDAKQN